MTKKRVILWWMLLSGVAVNYLFVGNINVAIVSMVVLAKPNEDLNITGLGQVQEFQETKIGKNFSFDSSAILKYESNVTVRIESSFRYKEPMKLDWSEREQNIILGAYFWVSWISQFFGGLLSHKYGSKLIIGASNFVACTLSSFIPVAAITDVKLVVAVRLLQGFIGSLGIPAGMFSIIGQWAPPDEIGKFTSVILGIPLAISFGYPAFGFIAENLGWIWVFHSTTTVGLVWVILWYYLCYDTPDQHPTITKKERNYIKKSLSDSISREKPPIPWKKILTSIPFLTCVAVNFSQLFSLFVFNTYLPLYLKVIHGLKSTQTGFFMGITFLMRIVIQIFSAFLTDKMIRHGYGLNAVRKLATIAGVVIPGMILCSILYTNCNFGLAFGSIALFIVVSSLNNCGAQAAVMNISPNFSGITQGISHTIANASGFITSILVDYFQRNYGNRDMWKYIIFITACSNCVAGLSFALFGSSELQPWNSAKTKKLELLSCKK